ncbi:DUF4214 domain-containing protein [Methylobacterium sp. ID0610]|uniref:DUF4214 domain-containing protein n=1 Tax=Methylobacterium carpenticola TaxID=3344827 RepID=UPI0036BA6323
MFDRDANDMMFEILLKHRGKFITKRHLEIARGNVVTLRRQTLISPKQSIDLKCVQRYFSPAQTDYLSPSLQFQGRDKRKLAHEIVEEYQINIDNLSGKGMRKMRHLIIQNSSDVEFISAEDLTNLADDREFVSACYRRIFGREPDEPGFDHYMYMLHGGYLTRRQIVSEIWHSEEGQRRAVVVYDGHLASNDQNSSSETVENNSALPLVVTQNDVCIPGFHVHLKIDKDNNITGERGEFLLFGPKCLIEKGNYYIDIDIEVIDGAFFLEASAFAGRISLFSCPVRGRLRGEIGFSVASAMDLFEIRISGYGREQNRAKLTHLILRGVGD